MTNAGPSFFGSTIGSAFVGAPIYVGQWNTVEVRFSPPSGAGNGRIQVALNGTFGLDRALDSSFVIAQDPQLAIGIWADSDSDSWEGYFDDVQVTFLR